VSSIPASPAELAQRLEHASRAVRSVAALDLCRSSDPQALDILLAHLARESEEKITVVIVRRLAEAGHAPARPVLAALRDDPRTPIRLYHAAVLACDRLEKMSR
jgi:HEAT repeat protein